MGKFLKKSEVSGPKVPVTVEVPSGSEENLRVLVSNLTAKEIELLRKVSEKPALKTMALGVASKYV